MFWPSLFCIFVNMRMFCRFFAKHVVTFSLPFPIPRRILFGRPFNTQAAHQLDLCNSNFYPNGVCHSSLPVKILTDIKNQIKRLLGSVTFDAVSKSFLLSNERKVASEFEFNIPSPQVAEKTWKVQNVKKHFKRLIFRANY